MLDREQLSQALRAVPPDKRTDSVAVAEHLVKAGLLWRYQARKLLQGTHGGLKFGNYRILTPVGEGGMGRVFLARDVRNGQLLALKILPPKKAREEPRMLARFRRTALVDIDPGPLRRPRAGGKPLVARGLSGRALRMRHRRRRLPRPGLLAEASDGGSAGGRRDRPVRMAATAVTASVALGLHGVLTRRRGAAPRRGRRRRRPR